MIQTLKDAIKDSIILKAFLGLMTLSFGIWGVGDFLRPGADPSIAVTVAGTEISASDLQTRFTREMQRFKEALKGKSGPEVSEIKLSLLNGVAQEMSSNLAVDIGAKKMGVVVTDNEIRDAIRSQAAFHDETGAFSQFRYQQALMNNNMTERMFVTDVSADLRQQALIAPTVNNATPPLAMVDPIISYRTEMRTADTLLVSDAAVPLPKAATDEELKKVYDDNIATFTAPEYRKVTVLLVRADNLVSPESLPDDQVKAYYDDNMTRYRRKETRDVAQLVFDSKEKADAARALMTPGDHLDDIARKAKIAPAVDLGDLKHEDPLAKTIGSAYDLPVGEISQPIQTELGWHLFEVRAIAPEATQDFATVEPEIRKALAEDKGTDALYDASTSVEDGLAGGTSLEDIAKKVNGQIVTIDAVDQQGKNPAGSDAAGGVDKDHFTETAFATPAGSHSRIMEISKGYYVLRVDAVTPAKPKPFDEVRKQVTALWEQKARQEAAANLVANLLKDIGPSTSLADLAAKDKVASFAAVGPVTRFGEAPKASATSDDTKRLSPDLLDKLFAAKVGDVVSAPVADGLVIARVREIVPSSGTAASQNQIADTIKQSLANDLVSELRSAFVERYPATLNKKAIDQVASEVH